MKKLRTYKREWVIIFILPLIILLINFWAEKTGLYFTIDILDEIMHFSGGVAIGIVYFLLLRIAQRKGVLGEMNGWMYYVFVISLVALTAVGWEFYEYFLDVLFSREFLRQPSVADTIGDLFMGLVGGSIGFLIMKVYTRRKEKNFLPN